MLPGRDYRVAVWAARAAACLLVVGCQPGVREDRTITFSPDGRASFQHGRNGVFVTDPATGKPERVYEPTADDLAVSPPLWDPSGRAMVFSVARSADGRRYELSGDAPADGRPYAAVPVRYSCWLYERTATAWHLEQLFEAHCGNVGVVAAGVAVAWHPDGRRLDYVDQDVPQGKHQVLTFDRTIRRAEPVPLPSADLVVLGSPAGGSRRAAVLSDTGGSSGVWVAEPAGERWWQVPDSAPKGADLVALRRRLPCWSRDGTKLAFVNEAAVRVCDTATRQTETRFLSKISPPDLRDLHWHPDGARLGLLERDRLLVVGPGEEAKITTDSSVESFAGWDTDGRRAAYVTAEPLPYLDGARWAVLLVPNFRARSAVRVADRDGREPGRVLTTGVRATFPHWSPDGSRLSVWLTVEPPYRLAHGGSLGMPPGDPAALLDPDTGALEWLPVNGTEHAQIGHIELKAGRLDAALRRFDEAASALPPAGKADWMFFRAVALQKAGRASEVPDAWRRFEPPRTAGTNRPRSGAVVRIGGERVQDAVTPRHRFAAEAYVSLDMAAEGIAFFQQEAGEARSDPGRLSARIVLCQLLLLADRRAEYADQVAAHLLADARRAIPGAGPDRKAFGRAVALTLLPLAVDVFAASLPDDVVRRVEKEAAAGPEGGDDVDFACQLVLRTCGRRLLDGPVAERAAARLTAHPARPGWNIPVTGEVNIDFLSRIRADFLMQDLLRNMFGVISTPLPAR